MKKFTLVALAMMASASCFAQTTLWDGEDKEIGQWNASNGFWDRLFPAVVENPTPDGINTTAKCTKFTITGNNFDNGSIVLPINDGLDMSTNKRLSIMIKKPHWSNVIIELSDGNYHKKIAANYNGDNEGKWQKLVFDFTNNCDFGGVNPTQLAIYPGIEKDQENSQEIYVDEIVLEDNPTVNENSLWSADDGSLKGNLTLTGGYFKTECMNVDKEWENSNIDDFAKLNDKLSANVTSIDMRKASTLGVDINKFFENKNPNTIVYANQYYDRGDNNYANIVVGDIAKSLELTDAYAFNAPEGFKAESVKLTRGVKKGVNSFVLPFEVTADELGATKVATYKDCELGKVANFITAESVGDNTPFLTMDVAEAKATDVLNFENKAIVATPETLGEDFVGVYTPQGAEGKYGIDDKGLIHKGGEHATIAAFHAYLNVTGSAAPAAIAFNGSTPTAINGVAADKVANTAVYDLSGRRVYGKLQKGLYIMNGKKFVVK